MASVTVKIIILAVLACIAGVRKPIFGGLAGMVTAPGLAAVAGYYDPATIVVLAAFGFGFGLILGLLSWNIFHGTEYNRQNEKTYYMPLTRNMRGGFIYTDEEAKNAKENKKKTK